MQCFCENTRLTLQFFDLGGIIARTRVLEAWVIKHPVLPSVVILVGKDKRMGGRAV